MMESADSSSGSQHPQLPPGFRFHPTDEELVVHYLKKKAASAPLPVTIIAEVDLYKFDPWELPSKAMFGEQEWYFFSPRDRKYPNGARPNRAATSGYWKATGTDKPILTSQGSLKVGVKKALVFYGGKPPKGIKTNWIMHEYRLVDNKYSVNNNIKPHPVDLPNKKASLRLDDWVLCRIYKKNNSQQQRQTERDMNMNKGDDHTMDGMFSSPKPPGARTVTGYEVVDAGEENLNFFEGILTEHHHQQLGGNGNGSSNKHQNSSTTSLSTATFAPAMKRSLPGTSTHQYWNETGKRFHGDLNGGGGAAAPPDDEESNSFVSLLNQLPHQAHAGHSNPFQHPNSLGGFQLTNMNWNS